MATPVAHRLHVRLFGGLDLRLDGEPARGLESGRARELLAFLILHDLAHDGAPLERQRLAFVLWPDSTEGQARTNLRHVLHTLRAADPGVADHLDVTPRTLRWRAGPGCRVDVADFEAALDRAGRPGAPDEEVDAALRDAIALYAGDLLEGSYEDWVVEDRERLRDRYVDALVRATQRIAAAADDLAGQPGRRDEAIRLAHELLRCDPLREDSHRLLMRLHDEAGDRASALRAYHACEAVLRRELGVEPSAETTAAYQALLHRSAARSSGGAAERGGPIPSGGTSPVAGSPLLVGRAAEWDAATACWRAVAGGGARLLLVAGEPGIGKTHLVEELARWCRQGDAVVAQTRAYATEGELGYGGVVSWLRHPEVAAHLGRLREPERAELARLLPELDAGPAPEPVTDGPAGEAERRRRLFEVLGRALLATGRPTVLVADDAQWCDPPTLQFLHYLVRLDPRSPLLVVATARREDLDDDHPLRALVGGLRAIERAEEIELGRLDRDETGQLVTRLLGAAPDGARLDALHTETEGNPLFIVEAVRAGASVVPGGGVTLSPKLQAVIGSRLQQLSSGARELAGLASAVGREFTTATLTAASELGDDALVAGLDELWRRGVVRERGAEAYDFAHGRIRDVAYDSLSPAARRRNHTRIARALVGPGTPDAAAVSGEVAHHFDLGGRTTEAIAWYRRAAVEAQRRQAPGESLRLLERAHALSGRLPGATERTAAELAILSALPTPLAVVEGFGSDRLAATQQQAVELARSLGVDPDPSVLRSLAMSHLCRDEPVAARAVAHQLRDLAGRIDDEVLAAESEYLLGIAAFWSGEFGTARHLFEGVVHRFRAERRTEHLLRFGQDAQVVCLSRLANTLWFLGAADQARATCDAALERAATAGHPFSHGVVLVFAALLAVDEGDADRYRDLVTDLRAAAEHQPRLLVPEVFEGYLDVLDGRAPAGLRRIRAVTDHRLVDHAPGQRSTHLRLLLAAHEAAGDAEAGLAATDEARRFRGTNIWAAEARRLGAEFLAALGRPAVEVAAALAEADALAGATGAIGLQRRIDASRARLGAG